MIATLAAKEFKSLLLSPLGWAVLVFVQLIGGALFYSQLDIYLQMQAQIALAPNAPGATAALVSPHYANSAILLLLVIPLLTMRLIAEERRNKTLTLLFSAPLSLIEIVLGKFLGVFLFLLLMVALLSLAPLALFMGGSLDLGLWAANIMGMVLMAGCFTAAGLLLSSLTQQPMVAALSTFGLLLSLWVIDWVGDDATHPNTAAVMRYLSLTKHYEPLLRGVFDSSDVFYYLLLTGFFLVLCVFHLDNQRLRA